MVVGVDAWLLPNGRNVVEGHLVVNRFFFIFGLIEFVIKRALIPHFMGWPRQH